MISAILSVPSQPVMHPPADLPLDNPLWETALDLWSNPEIADACLALQEEGISVSRLLMAVWLAKHDISWNGEEAETVMHWRNAMTGNLRKLRQELGKTKPNKALRDKIKEAELEAERIELAWIYHGWRQHCHNMSEYSVYNEMLLIRNLHAAIPNGNHSTSIEAGMSQLIQALQNLISTSHASQILGGSPR